MMMSSESWMTTKETRGCCSTLANPYPITKGVGRKFHGVHNRKEIIITMIHKRQESFRNW